MPLIHDLTPISHLVNTFDTFSIKSDRFEGIMSVHIKGFVDENGQARESAYFKGTNGNGSPKGTYAHTNVSSGTGYPAASGNVTPTNGNGGCDTSRKGVTWSIQVKGWFLQEISSDDVLFGNTFDRPLKLPWGSGAALKFM
ncbi:3129_t:CDS:1, partial [Acaulospora colombiana]